MSLTVLIVVGLYFLITLGLGLFAGRQRQPVADDYFLAGRKLPWYAVGGSLAVVDGGIGHFLPLLGLLGAAYTFGLAPAALDWVALLAFSILIWVLLPYLYRRRCFTLPELLDARFGPGLRGMVAGLSLALLVLVVLGPAWYAAGQVLYRLGLGGETAGASLGLIGAIAAVAVVTAIVCTLGGLAAVTWTGLLQAALLLAGGLVLVLLGAAGPGGVAEAIRANGAVDPSRLGVLRPIDHPVFPWTGVAAAWLALSTWYTAGNQMFVQRCLGARSEWDAKMGLLVAAVLRIALMFLVVLAGLVALARFGAGRPPNEVALALAAALESPLGRAVVAVGLIAALSSAAASALSAAATLWVFDFHQRTIDAAASESSLIAVGRAATVVLALFGLLAAVLLAWLPGGVIDYLNDLAAVAAPAVGVVLLAAAFWRRAHGRAVAFTVVAGMLFGLLLGALSIALWSFHTLDFDDPAVRRRITEDPAIQQRLQENEAYQNRLAAIMFELAQDPLVRRQLAADPELRARFVEEPEVQAKLAEDPAVWKAIRADEQIAARLAEDPELIEYWAADRLDGWIPLVPRPQVERAVAMLGLVRSRLHRAAASFAVCLVLLVLSTLIIGQDPGERYDPDTLWTPGYARLPAHEREAAAGPGNVLFWWLVAMVLVGALFVVLG